MRRGGNFPLACQESCTSKPQVPPVSPSWSDWRFWDPGAQGQWPWEAPVLRTVGDGGLLLIGGQTVREGLHPWLHLRGSHNGLVFSQKPGLGWGAGCGFQSTWAGLKSTLVGHVATGWWGLPGLLGVAGSPFPKHTPPGPMWLRPEPPGLLCALCALGAPALSEDSLWQVVMGRYVPSFLQIQLDFVKGLREKTSFLAKILNKKHSLSQEYLS